MEKGKTMNNQPKSFKQAYLDSLNSQSVIKVFVRRWDINKFGELMSVYQIEDMKLSWFETYKNALLKYGKKYYTHPYCITEIQLIIPKPNK